MHPKTAFLSDVHGNSPALRAVLDDIQREGCNRIFMLGDLINGIDPHGCVQLILSWVEDNKIELACIKGNAEAYVLTPDRNLLPKQDEEWNMDMIHLAQWWQDHLTPNDIEWLATFPETLRWNDAYLVHDSPMDRIEVQKALDILPHHREWFFHGRGLLPDMPEEKWHQVTKFMEQNRLKQIFCGHTHIPFQKTLHDKLICNIGSAGMPQDGDYRASWVLWENDVASIKRVDYDASMTHAIIESNLDYYDFNMPGYREAYKKWIATGIFWRKHMPK